MNRLLVTKNIIVLPTTTVQSFYKMMKYMYYCNYCIYDILGSFSKIIYADLY